MSDEIDAIVDAIIERGSPTLDRIIAERDELRASVEALLVLNQDLRAKWQAAEADAMEWAQKADELRADVERLTAAVVEIGAAHVAAQAECERLKTALYQVSRSANYIDNLAQQTLDRSNCSTKNTSCK